MDYISLPQDILIELLLLIKTTGLLNLCSSNRQLSHLCNNDFFWHRKVQQLNIEIPKPLNKSWKQHFIDLTSTKSVPLTILNSGDSIGTLKIKYTDTIETVLNNANELFFSTSNIAHGIALLFQNRNNKILATIANPFTQPTYYGINPDDYIGELLFDLETLSYAYPVFYCTMGLQSQLNRRVLPSIYPLLLLERYLPQV